MMGFAINLLKSSSFTYSLLVCAISFCIQIILWFKDLVFVGCVHTVGNN